MLQVRYDKGWENDPYTPRTITAFPTRKDGDSTLYRARQIHGKDRARLAPFILRKGTPVLVGFRKGKAMATGKEIVKRYNAGEKK